jgi:hypothetical protein
MPTVPGTTTCAGATIGGGAGAVTNVEEDEDGDDDEGYNENVEGAGEKDLSRDEGGERTLAIEPAGGATTVGGEAGGDEGSEVEMEDVIGVAGYRVVSACTAAVGWTTCGGGIVEGVGWNGGRLMMFLMRCAEDVGTDGGGGGAGAV